MNQQEKVVNYYIQKIEETNKQLNRLKKKKPVFGWLRLGVVGAIALAFYFLWQVGPIYLIAASILLVLIFARLVYADVANHEKIVFAQKMLDHLQNEIKALNGEFIFANGQSFLLKDHPYAADLDIFGENSLFQFLNRTTSEPGSAVLADFLQKKAEKNIITDRQMAVKELSTDNDWAKKFQTTGSLNPFSNLSGERLLNWCNQKPYFLTFRPWQILRYMMPAIVISVIVLYIFGYANNAVFYSTLLLAAIINYQIGKVVGPIHQELTEMDRQLKGLSGQIELVEQKKFQAVLLIQLQQHFLHHNVAASTAIKRLTKLMSRLDLRYNLVISAPLNLVLFWNLQQILNLEKWKESFHQPLNNWIDSLTQLEALNSLGIFAFNYPQYAFPEIIEDYFYIDGKSIGHPLINSRNRVNNPIHISSTSGQPNLEREEKRESNATDHSGKVMLVTGSNMAGKSTYLRSIGVNCVLAFCGAPVCAEAFTISLVDLFTSMRIADNLQENTSTFYAELKKLKAIIDQVNSGNPIFILLDEILRGTNSADRHAGSRTLIKRLIEKNTYAIIATHDLELAQLKDSFAANILNYHFDVQVNGEELYFDYLLKEGICTSMNASILMKKIGIEIN